MHYLITALSVAFFAFTAFPAVNPAGVFTDYTVLQQGEPVRIWGTAAPGERVTVQFADQTQTAVTDEAGHWTILLKEMPACAEGRPLIFKGSETASSIELKDVLVGEVWLAGGQSNMASAMNSYRSTVQSDINNANDPLLRMITIPNKFYEGENDEHALWKITTPQNAAGFSASAYYFAKNLRETLKVPVGIIACSVGGTPAEAWMSRETLSSNPPLKKIIDAYDAGYRKCFPDEKSYSNYLQEYAQATREWNRKQASKEAAGPRPVEKMGPRNKNRPCGLYETMLTQTIPFTVKGIIWYQGENNANSKNSFHYRTVFPALISEWRDKFKNPDLPFLFVQLAAFGPETDETPYWPELREAQSWTEDHVKNSGMIVLTDGGDLTNIHPHSKDKVGYRLSLLARNLVYGENMLICRGPRLEKAEPGNDCITLTFKDAGSGLVLKPGNVSAFEICGSSGNYVPAKAELADGKIIVSSDSVTNPQFVRYGWKKWFIPTLFNAEGLPASPFRTDNFPAASKNRYYLDDL